MALITVGNTHPDEGYCNDEMFDWEDYDIEIPDEDDEDAYYDFLWSNFAVEDSYVYFVFKPRVNTANKEITLYYYNVYPDFDYEFYISNYGRRTTDIMYPIVYKRDTDELINADIIPVDLRNKNTGWYSVKVKLKENLTVGNEYKIGFYSDFMVLGASSRRYEYEFGLTQLDAGFFWKYNDDKQTAFFSENPSVGEWWNKNHNNPNDYCIYITYDDTPKQQNYKLNLMDNLYISQLEVRKVDVYRKYQEHKLINTIIKKSKIYKLFFDDTKGICTWNYRKVNKTLLINQNVILKGLKNNKSNYRKSKNCSFLSKDNFYKSLICFRKFDDGYNLIEIIKRFVFNNRKIKSQNTLLIQTTHKGNYRRISNNDFFVSAKAAGGKVIFVILGTFFSVIDFLKRKIKDVNNVISYFCPLDIEITFNCKI